MGALTPLISIITPAYNAEKFIGETIKSVQQQTYQNWELIIVDDCSKDYTSVLVNDYVKEDHRIRLIKAPQNGGVAKARNIGLENAKGDYIAFVDSDDLWMPEKLEKQLAYMQASGCVLSYTDFQKFNTTDGSLGKVMKCPNKMRANDILKNTAIGCLTVMVDKKQTGEFRMPPLNHTEDNCTWYHILKKTNQTAYNIGEVLSLYRDGNASMTKNKGKSAKQQWYTYRGYFKFSRIKSAYYFICYAINAILRHF